jgi:predicted dinucleotide-binding enzyme
MKVGVLGSGIVGRTLAGKLALVGNDVMLGTRDVDDLLARTETGPMGTPPFSVWHDENPAVALGAFPEAAAFAEMVVNATAGVASLDALTIGGGDGGANLAGKILVDVSNPLDFSSGMPPTLSIANTDSLSERIQAAFPGTMVVKALNTVSAPLMVDPGAVGGGDHTMFIAGNDAASKATVAECLKTWFGWQDVMDLGDITNARGMEMYLPLWVRLFGVTQGPMFNVKVVR